MLENILKSGFEELGIAADERVFERYRIYHDFLEEKNKVMNLTAISGEEDVAKLHFLDCAALLRLHDFSGKTMLDVGSGAGFPGMALKIACPELKVTLLDSLDKRVNFLRELAEKLGFEDVNCVHLRAEEAPADYRQGFDIVTSRAVARLNLLCELCLPFVKKGGVFIAMKGPDCSAELEEAKKAIAILGGKVRSLSDYAVPGLDVSHNALIIEKVKDTPPKYPRRWAQIKKQPL